MCSRDAIRTVVAVAVGVVMGLAGHAQASDEPDELIPGTSVFIKGTIGGDAGAVKFRSEPPAGEVFALPSPANDPTSWGGTFWIRDTAGTIGNEGGSGLLAENWRALGNPPGSKGFRYTGRRDPFFNPNRCKVLIAPKRVRATCRPFRLFPPFLGDAAITITVGDGSKRYCARVSNLEPGQGGAAIRQRGGSSPPPTTCSPCKAFLDETGEFL